MLISVQLLFLCDFMIRVMTIMVSWCNGMILIGILVSSASMNYACLGNFVNIMEEYTVKSLI